MAADQEIVTSFGYWVRRRRKALDLTQAALAQAVGCALVTLKKIEWDERRPSPQMAERLADCLAISPAEKDQFLRLARGEFVTVTLSPSAGVEAHFFKHNLPAQATPFIGRKKELADVVRRFSDPTCRLLTLVGPGGISKTRLAIQTAQTIIETGTGFTHGLAFVSLTGVSSIGGMISAMAEAVKFTFYSNVPPRQQLLNYLRERNLLLILDNLEHLLAEGSALISDILAAAPAIKILATSREALNLREAWFHPVVGMSFPSPKLASLPETEEEQEQAEGWLEKYDSVQLFIQCARRVRVEFSLITEQTYVVRICQLVEGMPLGIELAASWLKMLPAEKIVRELERGLDILSSRLQNVPERHRSIRAVFEHSWQLLGTEARMVMQPLSIFRGGFTEEAAGQVAAAALSHLATLVETSLLQVTESGRYQIHELLRQFAAEKLSTDPEIEMMARSRHSAYYLEFLRVRTEMLNGPAQQRALAEIGEEIENVEMAWRWAAEQGRLEALDQALESLYNFYEFRSRYQEGKELFADTIAQLKAAKYLVERPERKTPLNRLLARQGYFHYFLGEYEAAHKQLEAGLDLANQPRDQVFMLPLREVEQGPGWAVDVILSLQMLGQVASVQGSYAVAETYFRQSLALSREWGNLKGVAEALGGLAGTAASCGDFVSGKQRAGESLAINRQLGQPVQLARALFVMGWCANCLGEYREAEGYWQESLVICQEIGEPLGIADGLILLGWAAWCEGGARLKEAVAYYKKALAINRAIGHRRNLAMGLGDLALAVSEIGEYEQALQYAREGLAITEEIGHLDLMSYNLWVLGAATCGLGDFQASRNYLTQSLRTAWEAQITVHAVAVLFYFAILLAKEADLAGVTEPTKIQQKAKALELLAWVIAQPSCSQPIKDRVVRFQAQLEAELPSAVVGAARARAKVLTLEAIIVEEKWL